MFVIIINRDPTSSNVNETAVLDSLNEETAKEVYCSITDASPERCQAYGYEDIEDCKSVLFKFCFLNI